MELVVGFFELENQEGRQVGGFSMIFSMSQFLQTGDMCWLPFSALQVQPAKTSGNPPWPHFLRRRRRSHVLGGWDGGISFGDLQPNEVVDIVLGRLGHFCFFYSIIFLSNIQYTPAVLLGTCFRTY